VPIWRVREGSIPSSTHRPRSIGNWRGSADTEVLMHDTRPVWKRAKFIAFGSTMALLVGSWAANMIRPGTVVDDVQVKLAEAIAFGLPALLAAQGFIDQQRVKSSSSSSTAVRESV
jgi:hypothetical protein